MKLLVCPKCKDMIVLSITQTRKCECGTHAGKYAEDKITAIVTEGSILVGIDNNSYRQALVNAYSEQVQSWNQRVDFYFTGWVPNFPGEVIYKKTPLSVKRYKLPVQQHTTTSTTPKDSS